LTFHFEESLKIGAPIGNNKDFEQDKQNVPVFLNKLYGLKVEFVRAEPNAPAFPKIKPLEKSVFQLAAHNQFRSWYNARNSSHDPPNYRSKNTFYTNYFKHIEI
jgi:hypothetical protein